MILVSSVAFIALAILSHQAQHETLSRWRNFSGVTLSKWKEAVVAAQTFAMRERMNLVDRKVFIDLIEPPDRAVDTLMGAMRFKHHQLNLTFQEAATQEDRVALRVLETRAWETLNNQWNCNLMEPDASQTCSGRTDNLYVITASGNFAGSAFASVDGEVQQRLLSKNIGNDLEIWDADNSDGSRLGMLVRQSSFHPRQQSVYTLQVPWSSERVSGLLANESKAWTQLYLLRPWHSADPNWYRKVDGIGEWGGTCTCPDGQVYEVGDNVGDIGCQTIACEGGTAGPCSSSGISPENAGKKVTCNTFGPSNAVGSHLSMSRTQPISLSGNFGGVVAADISLELVSSILWTQWVELRWSLIMDWNFSITDDSSGIFIVNQMSPLFPEQEGLLIGTSKKNWYEATGNVLKRATASSLAIVSHASKAILAKHGNWSADGLLDAKDEVFYFSVDAIQDGRFETCNPLDNDEDCVQVATHSMSIDERARWLVVVALPSEAYFKTYNYQVLKTTDRIDTTETNVNMILHTTNVVCMIIVTIAVVFAVLVASIMSCLVLRPLSRLGVLMERLSHLDFAKFSPEYKKLQRGVRGRIREVNVIREGFCQLSRSIEAFARFVPEAVVRELISPDETKRKRATESHLYEKNVTIMSSDVADFTTISEALSQTQLCILLTAYLTTMTRIIENFEGVVGEVLGDGLLCYWNTPDRVEDHAAKACMAALAQQQALGPLNAFLERQNLPQLKIRIGLHTGKVLAGNIGTAVGASAEKLKFGCIGDPVNFANRLESLCKVYGCGIMVSGTTHDALPEEYSFVTRRLDLVQAKEKEEPTCIHELIGRTYPLPEWDLEPVAASVISQAQLYEEALDAYHNAKFDDAVQIAEILHRQRPADLATTKLLEKAKVYATQRSGGGGLWGFLSPSSNTRQTSAEQLPTWTGVEKVH
jgi:class 3 adenylate cyclase